MSSQNRCPGGDSRQWTPGEVRERACPGCGREMEFFPDEPVLSCPGCGREVPRPGGSADCAAWCPAAERCRGRDGG